MYLGRRTKKCIKNRLWARNVDEMIQERVQLRASVLELLNIRFHYERCRHLYLHVCILILSEEQKMRVCDNVSTFYLSTLFQWLRLYSVEWRGNKWMMKWKGCGRKRPWPNFNLLFQHLSENSEENRKKVGIAGLRDQVWTRDLPNKMQ
jgi:hypothetical protein